MHYEQTMTCKLTHYCDAITMTGFSTILGFFICMRSFQKIRWRFCSLFSSIRMVWCVISSCKKVAQSITNIILKFVWSNNKKKNTQNCGKTSHGYCTTIMHQLTHHCLFLMANNNAVIMSQSFNSHATFSCFQNWRDPWKDWDLLWLRR